MHQEGASARNVLVSSLVLNKQALSEAENKAAAECTERGKRRRGVPRCQAKVSISMQRDQDQQDVRTEVTVDPKMVSSQEPLAGEDHLLSG